MPTDEYATWIDEKCGLDTPAYLTEGDSGLVILCDHSTNSVEVRSEPVHQRSSTDLSYSIAVTAYGDLLRRLAD